VNELGSRLALGPLAAELDRLAGRARCGALLAEDLEKLLGHSRELAVAGGPEPATAPSGWQAVHRRSGGDHEEVFCWLADGGEEVVLTGRWSSGILAAWSFALGEVLYAARQTGEGQSRIGPGDEEGPADARRRERSQQAIRSAIDEGIKRLVLDRGRPCVHCGAMNDEDALECAICRAGSPWASAAAPAAVVFAPPEAATPARRGPVLELSEEARSWLGPLIHAAKESAEGLAGESGPKRSPRRKPTARSQPGSETKKSEWVCGVCGRVNRVQARTCIECGNPPPAAT